MTLQQLEYIVALDDHRHYVKAAETCFISQPNLTMQVKKLESEIGVRIFDRDKKPLVPTAIGTEVITRARQILRETRQLTDFVDLERDAVDGRYNLAIIPTLAPYLLPEFLPGFIQANPGIHLNIREMQTSGIIENLFSGSIDIAILATPLNEPALREIPLFYEPFLLYLPVNHKLRKLTYINSGELDLTDLLVLEEGHCFRNQALSICSSDSGNEQTGFDYQSGSIEALKKLVLSGMGYTLIPELSVTPEDAGMIRQFRDPAPNREVSIVVHNNFIRRTVLDRLKNSILDVIPPHLTMKEGTRITPLPK